MNDGDDDGLNVLGRERVLDENAENEEAADHALFEFSGVDFRFCWAL